jgi:hypothetical protein
MDSSWYSLDYHSFHSCRICLGGVSARYFEDCEQLTEQVRYWGVHDEGARFVAFQKNCITWLDSKIEHRLSLGGRKLKLPPWIISRIAASR